MEVLIIKEGDKIIQTLQMNKDEFSIGADSSNDIVLDNLLVASQHAKIVKEGDNWIFRDLNSDEGSYLNDMKIMEHILEDGDEIQISNFMIIYDEGFVNDEETETKIVYDELSDEEQKSEISNPKLLADGPNGEKIEYLINKASVIVGRSLKADIVIEDTTISRMHAKISLQNGKFYIRDLESRNGTFVNKKKISIAEIKDGDIITFGTYSTKFII